MGTTTNRGYPYYAASDPPQGNAQQQALAEAADAAAGILQFKTANIPAEQSRTNTVYGKLGTADEVTGIVLPTDGLIVVGFQALWKESVANAARAALFLGSDQIKRAGSGSPSVQEAPLNAAGGADLYAALSSSTHGLSSGTTASGAGSDVTTGQVLGAFPGGDDQEGRGPASGVCHLFAAAGTYTISVQFKASSGSVTVKERKLWVWSMLPKN